MSSLPIADYALLSDCHSAALVSQAGSVDWFCAPRFDGPAVFGRLLDAQAPPAARCRPAGGACAGTHCRDGPLILAVTAEQMREVDRLMVEAVRVDLLQMMENAGRALAEQARRMLGGDARGRRAVVLAGGGGNGGGGLAAARRLSIWGARVSVVLGQEPASLRGAPARQVAIVERLALPVYGPQDRSAPERELVAADITLDALLGYRLHGAPREPIATLIRAANGSGSPILALDVPSGLDPDRGEPAEPTIRASATLTLALPKVGLTRPAARLWIGDLYLADISVPEAVYRRLGLTVGSLFAHEDILRIPLPDGSPHRTAGQPENLAGS